jgi:hypothetical protein
MFTCGTTYSTFPMRKFIQEWKSLSPRQKKQMLGWFIIICTIYVLFPPLGILITVVLAVIAWLF